MRDLFLANDRRPGNIVFDLDGVIFLGSNAIFGAGDALEAVARYGINVFFATHNATRTTRYIALRIESTTGYAPGRGTIVTSATSTAAALKPRDGPILVIGETGLSETLREAGHTMIDDPDRVRTVVVGLDRDIRYDKLERASSAIRGGARFMATNTDATFPTTEGPVPGAGAIVAAIAAASGVEPEIAGKPHPAMVSHISQILGPGETWMVGDRPETDLAIARTAGWRSVLTLTGITKDARDVAPDLKPDLVIDSIADLASLFA